MAGCGVQAVANSSLTSAIVRTGRVEADAPSSGQVELAAQGGLPAGATISPTQVWDSTIPHPRPYPTQAQPRSRAGPAEGR